MEAVRIREIISSEPWNTIDLVDCGSWSLDNIGDPINMNPPSTMLLESETLIGSINKHPRMLEMCPDLFKKLHKVIDGNEVVIIGGGNVAIDILRFFVSDRESYDKNVIHEEAATNLKPKRVHVVLRGNWWDMKATASELRDFLDYKAMGVSYEVRGFHNCDRELNRAQKKLKNIFDQLIAIDDCPGVAIRTEVVFHFRSQVDQIDVVNRQVKLKSGNDIPNVGLVVAATGFKVKEPPKTTQTPSLPLETVGWLSTGGRGTLADSLNSAARVYSNISKLIDASSVEHSGRVLYTDTFRLKTLGLD